MSGRIRTFPLRRLRPLRVLRTRPHRQLVERPKRVLAYYHCRPWLSSRERCEIEARRAVRRRARPSAANARLHAACSKNPCCRSGSAEGSRARKKIAQAERAAKAIQDKLDCLGRGILCLNARSISRYTTVTRRNCARSSRCVRIERHYWPARRTRRGGHPRLRRMRSGRAADLWVQASLEQRQRFQQLFFPDGIALTEVGFPNRRNCTGLQLLAAD